MGPIALFDKSFLQALNLDESVWLDHFFLCNICPLFYIETLADLEKSVKKGRPPEKIVGEIAAKFPEMNGMACSHHLNMCIGELLGNEVPMNGQIPISTGRPIKASDKSGVVVEPTPEAEAFNRWQRGDFLSIERKSARLWREQIRNIQLYNSYEILDQIGIGRKYCKNFENAKAMADEYVSQDNISSQQLVMAISLLGIPTKFHNDIIHLWISTGKMPLSEYSPYVAYLMTVELFFRIAMRAGLISSNRNSNRIDIAYLYYLPFSQIFISSDKLHRKCVPLFLRSDQEFLWGIDLKDDLHRINQHYESLPNHLKEQGVHFFAEYPPQDKDYLVSKIWSNYLTIPKKTRSSGGDIDPYKNAHIIKEMKQYANAPSLTPDEVNFDLSNPDMMVVKRLVHKRKGSWHQLPKDIKD